ncbi:MAG: carboxypeptidase-like regulatory domain-containing protein [Acidobacteriota bacterium]
MRPVRGLAFGLCLVLGCVASLVPAASFALSTGDPVAISGRVTDTGGHPLVGLRIALLASRKSLRRGENEVRRVAANTDAGGAYTISWPWDPYFNRFELQAGVAIRRGKEEKFEVFERQSLSARQLESGAVNVPVIIREGDRLAKLRSFETQVKTADERRVFAELGQPEEVRIVEYPDRRESTWWYFEAGRAYRFESGRLVQVIPFDPIRKF